MSKKNTTYILIGLVVLIWGLIGYKIIESFSQEEEIVSTYDVLPQKEAKEDYALVLNYPDPFLKNQFIEKKHTEPPEVVEYPNSPNTSASVQPPIVPQPKLPKPSPPSDIFPSIIYYGIIRQSENPKDRVYLVQVGGINETFNLSEKKEEVKLISGDAEKIQVRYKGTNRTFEITN